MSKYNDLADQINRDHGAPWGNSHDGIRFALSWLDNNPDQVPGRTITESESKDLFNTARRGLMYWPDALERTCITVIPDPEPTNAEKLEAHLLDLLGVVEAIGNTGVHNMAYELDRAGVTALGGGNE